MKNTVRVRHNSGINHSSAQVQAKRPYRLAVRPNAELNELESAKNQSCALTQLLAESLMLQNAHGNWSEEFGDRMCVGIIELVAVSKTRLDCAFESLNDALPVRSSEVTS